MSSGVKILSCGRGSRPQAPRGREDETPTHVFVRLPFRSGFVIPKKPEHALESFLAEPRRRLGSEQRSFQRYCPRSDPAPTSDDRFLGAGILGGIAQDGTCGSGTPSRTR